MLSDDINYDHQIKIIFMLIWLFIICRYIIINDFRSGQGNNIN